MDSLEQYLESVRRSLDVRNKVEQEEIVVEIRDHILTLAEQLEAEGHEPEQALDEAIAHMGDSLLVASRVSEAHDGGSWQQAWVAVTPYALAAITMVVAAWLQHRPIIWLVWLAQFGVLIAGYSYLSQMITGRKWRMTWLASMVGSGIMAATIIAYVALIPKSPGAASLLAYIPTDHVTIDMSRLTPLTRWQAAFFRWALLIILCSMAVLASALMFRRRRWLTALLLLAPMSMAAATLLTIRSGGGSLFVPGLTFLNSGSWSFAAEIGTIIYGLVLTLILLHILVIQEWNGDWTMAWCFCLGLALPVAHLSRVADWGDRISGVGFALPAAHLSRVDEWGNLILGISSLLLFAASVLAYTVAPRKRAFVIFLIGAIAAGLLESVSISWTRGAPAISTGALWFTFLVFYALMEPADRKFHDSEQPSLPFDLPLGYQ